ncbi:4-hydroxythreonine-4-phosphate dehydrogenase PdxA [Paramixta manurensis]|uniref:4-hydroxythreonine-4-phosphate dehydrogenase PdxA n=1 Tax=Paramixta manurensis TaxID=2740817 RepID=A0A6M8ULA2_9GAMM|nr:4-hydroxythreonine-4-phosphate dehydrogenase PdxA [Erwiniaceae bacterium PD-1]
MSALQPVAITIGDPAGIGPELSLKVASTDSLMTDTPIVLIGSADLLRRVAAHLKIDVDIRTITHPREAQRRPGVAWVIDVPLDAQSVVPGELSRQCGQATVDAIRLSTELALAGEVCAVCSAPANKEAFHLAGHIFEGQTEIFAHLTQTTSFHTIMIGGPLRVSLISAHCSLLEAVARVKQPRIERIMGELHRSLREEFGFANPRIGVAGLNPHAGENGVLGSEEIEHIRPALENCRRQGMNVSDPLAADSLFWAAEKGAYDAVLAMYHDQGTIPLKRFGYVTYAVGLPIIRTTAGHGTAFDIAWQGVANAELLSRAAKQAESLALTKAQGPVN